MFVTPAYAQAAGPAGAGALMQFLPLIAIFVIMYFLMIRPQQKKMKQHRAMIDALSRGDQVVTAGGLIGRVVALHDEQIEVEIAPNTRVRVMRATITAVMGDPKAANTAASPKV